MFQEKYAVSLVYIVHRCLDMAARCSARECSAIVIWYGQIHYPMQYPMPLRSSPATISYMLAIHQATHPFSLALKGSFSKLEPFELQALC